MLQGQEKELTIADYGFQINENSISKKAPSGYESVLTVDLNNPLLPDKAYEVGFWIFGRQLQDRGYSYPIQVFPSNFIAQVKPEVFRLVKANDIMPKLEVNPPPTYKTQGHFTFVIRPDTIYHQVTVALKLDQMMRPPINIKKDVTVTGLFVQPLLENAETITEDKQGEIIAKTPKAIAARKLIDSEKSYTVSQNEVTIGLYDHRNIDKDRVTIYLNNTILVKDLELKKKKKFFKASLKPGKNTITLHAENLGEVAPNTAAISISTKSQEFMGVLESDLGQSQFFTIIYEPN